MYRTTVMASIFAMAAFTSGAAQSTTIKSNKFRWLDPHKDAALFGQIKAAFVDELKPDDPEKVKPVEPQLYKRISRIGIFQSSALVLIAERETPVYTYGDYFQPFNYDMRTGKKIAFEKGFRRWRFRSFAQFSSGKTPDIVFTYLSCTECEATHLLGSFRFDPKHHTWDTRAWSDKDDAVVIGSDSEEGDYDYQCLYKIADFNGDGMDDVAVRCQAVGEKAKIMEDTTLLYSIQQGKPLIITLTEPKRIAAVTAKLCEGTKKSRLCTAK